jgi:murein DD-endopeptidase MepM/ murein hydrolase activator NlpD
VAKNPTSAYRDQNGVPLTASGPDPQLVGWIKQAAQETGANAPALLATALQESGGRLHGPAGDSGTSFGPFQFHRGGALGSHAPAWASTYDAVLNRAQEFSRYGVRGGKGAAAVQRPADPHLYAQGVDSQLRNAERILGLKSGSLGPARAPATPAPGRAPRLTNDTADIGQGLLDSLMATNAQIAHLPGATSFDPNASPLQRLISSNAALAGIEAPTLPVAPRTPTPFAPAPTADSVTGPALAPQHTSGPHGKVVRLAGAPHLIGLPYQGTHRLYGNWESDNAIDIQLPNGTPVYAAADGTIGSQIGAIGGNDPHMAGQRLHLQIRGNELYYQHLKQIVVKAGQHVRAGQLLGYTGALNHLHLGVKNGKPQSYA